MSWFLVPCLVTLREQVNTAWPNRNKASDGTIGDLAHQQEPSDHNPDSTGAVRAFDITNDPQSFNMTLFVTALVASRDPRIKYVIWNGRMLRAYDKPGIPAWTWAPYTGADPHTNHVHLSVVSDSRANSTALWSFIKTQEQDDDMNASEYIALMKEAAERSTPAGRQLGTYMAQAIGANRIEAKVNALSARDIAQAVVSALPDDADAQAIAQATADEFAKRFGS